jgi:hypothetical protein
MDADHHELVLVLFLELGEIGHDVHAVDAAQRPEVQYNDLAAQIFQFQRLARVEPSDATIEFRWNVTIRESRLSRWPRWQTDKECAGDYGHNCQS